MVTVHANTAPVNVRANNSGGGVPTRSGTVRPQNQQYKLCTRYESVQQCTCTKFVLLLVTTSTLLITNYNADEGEVQRMIRSVVRRYRAPSGRTCAALISVLVLVSSPLALSWR